jgi:hypothetical protein
VRLSGPAGNGTGNVARRSMAASNRISSGCPTAAIDGLHAGLGGAAS